jgi:hypothetical protein
LAKAGRDLWHDCDAMPAARIFFQLIADFVVYLGLLIRPRKAIAAENLFLRRQLALYQERKVGPRRIDPAYAHYVGSALKVIQLARCAHCGSTEDVDSLASSRVSTFVALEIKTGAPSDSC